MDASQFKHLFRLVIFTQGFIGQLVLFFAAALIVFVVMKRTHALHNLSRRMATLWIVSSYLVYNGAWFLYISFLPHSTGEIPSFLWFSVVHIITPILFFFAASIVIFGVLRALHHGLRISTRDAALFLMSICILVGIFLISEQYLVGSYIKELMYAKL